MAAAPVDTVFKLFANDSKTVDASQVGDIVRSQGLCPTEKQLADAMQKGGISGSADLAAVKGVVKALEGTRMKNLAAELKNALATFDASGDGAVPISDLTHILTTSGEKVSVDMVNEIISMASSVATDSFGGLIYEQFATEAADAVKESM
eukprot:m.97327 g.97327  ORF g.97327 m.97327 type:complete len:150 (-) comp10208_c0_seq3:1803-2252(-)